MKQLIRFRTPRAGRVLLLLCTIAVALPAYHASDAASSALTSAETNPQGSPPRMLNVVLWGPFAVLDCSDGKEIRVVVPDVDVGSHKPLRIGYPFTVGSRETQNYPVLTRGEYTLGIPGPTSSRMEIVNPVEKTEALSFGTTECRAQSATCVNVCIDLPLPRQVVPWNADRLKVFRPDTLDKDRHWKRLATAMVLRYAVPDFEGIKLSRKDDSKPCGSKMPCSLTPKSKPNGTEGILALVLEPKEKPTTHEPAYKTFRKLMNLLGRNEDIVFEEDETCVRNQPLNGALRQELIDLLGELKKEVKDTNVVWVAVAENDCEPPMALVTNIKQKQFGN